MHNRRQLLSQLSAIAGILGFSCLPAWAEKQTLRFGSISPAGNSTYTQLVQLLLDPLVEASAERLAFAPKPAGGYGKPTDLLAMTERGEIEAAATVQGYHSGRFLRSSVIDLPFLFNDSFTGTRALSGLYRSGMLGDDYASVKVIALFSLQPYALLTTGKKISRLRDLRGLRVRTSSSTMGSAFARMGAIPLGIPSAETGNAIANGVVDAVAISLDNALGLKGAGDKNLSEQLSVAADFRFSGLAEMVVMNRAAWESLPQDLQAVIERVGLDFEVAGAMQRDVEEEAARKKYQADPRYTFLPFSQEMRDDMRKAMIPVYEDWKMEMGRRGIDGEQLLSRARELVQQAAAT